ncbi:MAG: pentapeptide repeat-containing protein [Fidelibacterota bacterium]|nr:MAG: pentapeptide repeat-containing protein [Candidatus Neomarinimicrobiota bacterium]
MRRGIIETDETPKISDNGMYLLLRDENIEEFNARRKDGAELDLSGLDFRGLDLRGINAKGIDFSNCYFRQANLAGLNLTHCKLEGASMLGAHISGAYFPRELSAAEILMSLNTGTRLRYGT